MAGQGGLGSFLPLILLVVAAYFLLIRPQQKRAKEQATMRASLEPGVEIMTMSGFFGTVLEIGDDRILIETVDGSQFEIVPQAVREIIGTPKHEELEGGDPSDDEPPIADEDDATDAGENEA